MTTTISIDDAREQIKTYLDEAGLSHILWNAKTQTIVWNQATTDIVERLLMSGYEHALSALEGSDHAFRSWMFSQDPPVASALLRIIYAKGAEWSKSLGPIEMIIEHSLKMHKNGWNAGTQFFRDAEQIDQNGDYFYAYLQCSSAQSFAEKMMHLTRGTEAAKMLALLNNDWTWKYPEHAQAYKDAILQDFKNRNPAFLQGLESNIGKYIAFPNDPDIQQALATWMDSTKIVKVIDRMEDFRSKSSNRLIIEYSFLRNQNVKPLIHARRSQLADARYNMLSNTPEGRVYIWNMETKVVARWLVHTSTHLDKWNDADKEAFERHAQNIDFYHHVMQEFRTVMQSHDHHKELLTLLCAKTDYLYYAIAECTFVYSTALFYSILKNHAHILRKDACKISSDAKPLTVQEMAYATLVCIRYPEADTAQVLETMHSLKKIYQDFLGEYTPEIALPVVKNLLDTTFGSFHALEDTLSFEDVQSPAMK